MPQGRVFVAVAAEADDKSIWSRLKMLPELLAAGPVAIRVGFFGAEGTLWREPGCRRAASPGKWWGHLAVVIEDEWLLDPTIDQANKKEWPHHVGPLAVRLSKDFWAEHGSILIQANKCSVRFSPHPRQIGFANAGDARPSHWKPLADQIFRALEVAESE